MHTAIVDAATVGRLDAAVLRGAPNKMLYTNIPSMQAGPLHPDAHDMVASGSCVQITNLLHGIWEWHSRGPTAALHTAV